MMQRMKRTEAMVQVKFSKSKEDFLRLIKPVNLEEVIFELKRPVFGS